MLMEAGTTDLPKMLSRFFSSTKSRLQSLMKPANP